MFKRVISWVIVASLCLFIAAGFTGRTKIEVDLETGRTRTTKVILGLSLAPTAEINENDFSRVDIQSVESGLRRTPQWRTAQVFGWLNSRYSPQYKYSWVLRMVRELSELFPNLEEAARGPFKRDFLIAVARDDFDRAGSVVSEVRRRIAEKQ